MPAGSPQAPILSCDPGEQLTALRRALAPQRWPLAPELLPAGTLLVGGAVRDALLGRLRPRPDLDLVVEEDAIALARALARRCGGSCVVLDAERSIARLVLKGWSFDLARRMGDSLQQDLARRDYSVNAIAVPLAALQSPEGSDDAPSQRALHTDPAPLAAEAPGSAPGSGLGAAGARAPQGAEAEQAPAADAAMQRGDARSTAGLSGAEAHAAIDPGGGLADLRARRMRALGEANLLEDPLRLLRGVRLACELGFSIEPQTLTWIGRHQRRLGEVAGERVLAELERLAVAPAGAEGLEQAVRLGLLGSWQGPRPNQEPAEPEPQPEGEPGPELTAVLALLNADHAERCGLLAAEAQQALPLARLAAVLTPTALERLHASRRLQQRCRRLRQWRQHLQERRLADRDGQQGKSDSPAGHLSLASLAEPERLALQLELEEDLPALALQLEPSEARGALARWRDRDDPLFHPRSPLDGRQLQQALGLPPGRTLGLLLAHLRGERAFGRLAPSAPPEQALQMARDWLADHDPQALELSAGPAP